MNAAEAAAQPGVAQEWVHGDGSIKPSNRLLRAILCSQQKSFQSQRFGIAGGKFEGPVQALQRAARSSKTEFQLRDMRPGEAELWTIRHRTFCKLERLGQRGFADG